MTDTQPVKSRTRRTASDAALQHDIAKRLDAHLRNGGWTSEYLAIPLGVTPRTVERWRRGDAPPPAYIWDVIDELEIRQQPRAPSATRDFAARMNAGRWSVAELASALGIPASTIRKWRRQAKPPALHAFVAIDAAERRRALTADG